MAATPRHHLVPQFLLREFADQAGRLRMIDRRDVSGAPRLVSVNNACNEAGFYRIDTDDVDPDHRDGHDPEVIEKHLSVFEARAKRALYTMVHSDPPWEPYDRFDVVNFVALQYVRGWRFRRMLDERGTAVMRHLLRSDPDRLRQMAVDLARSDGLPVNETTIAAGIEEMVGPRGPRLVSSKPNAIQIGLKSAFGPLGEMLWVRALKVVHFAPDTTLLTSDSPVATWSPGNTGRVLPLGTAAAVALPIAPTTALWFTRGGTDGHSNARAVRAAQINHVVADSAERWIFTHPERGALDKLAINPEPPVLAEGDEFALSDLLLARSIDQSRAGSRRR